MSLTKPLLPSPRGREGWSNNYLLDALAGTMQFPFDLLASISLSDFRPDDKRSSRINVRTVAGKGEKCRVRSAASGEAEGFVWHEFDDGDYSFPSGFEPAFDSTLAIENDPTKVDSDESDNTQLSESRWEVKPVMKFVARIWETALMKTLKSSENSALFFLSRPNIRMTLF